MCSDVEPHGQAVAESMAVGSAIVVSDRVGCVGPNDSARAGQNAVVYPAGDVPALAAVLERLSRDPAELERLKAESWRLASTQDIPVMVAATAGQPQLAHGILRRPLERGRGRSLGRLEPGPFGRSSVDAGWR